MSAIVGDITFVINQPIYRKTICDKSINDSTKPQHEKFGVIISDSISTDNSSFIEVESIESAIIDASIKMKIVDIKKHYGDKP